MLLIDCPDFFGFLYECLCDGMIRGHAFRIFGDSRMFCDGAKFHAKFVPVLAHFTHSVDSLSINIPFASASCRMGMRIAAPPLPNVFHNTFMACVLLYANILCGAPSGVNAF